MTRRPLPLALALAACLGVAPAPAVDVGKPRQHFAAHCDYAVLPNFVIPLKSIASRDDLTYSDDTQDAAGVATLARPGTRITTRFSANAVDVSEYGAPGRQDDDAFGRIVALFRFCDPLH